MKKALFCAALSVFLIIAHVLAQPPRAARALPPKFEVLETQLPDAKVQEALINLLLAVENADYERFMSALTINLRAHMDETLFKQVHDAIGSRMAPGYRVVYMGELHKPGYRTFIYKLVFKDKIGEVLSTLSFNADADGNIVEFDKPQLKVAGFYTH